MRIVRGVLAMLAVAASVNASAWMAIAADGDANYFVAYDYDTKNDARAPALAGCQARFTGCEVRYAVNGSALVIARGAGGAASAANPDPKKARLKALANCAEVARDCKVTKAYWDPGVRWSAVASSRDSAMQAVINRESREQAEDAALAACRAVGGEQCQVHPEFTTSARVFLAAVHGSGGSWTLGKEQSKARAEARGLKGCREAVSAKQTCKVVSTMVNDSSAPPPTAMRAIEAEAERNTRVEAASSPPGTAKSTARATQYTSCQNNCVNGSCVRTFPDGRKERWQAPRVYNPLKNDWEWDITTNACGG